MRQIGIIAKTNKVRPKFRPKDEIYLFKRVIVHRSKQTQAEAVKLKKIQKELQALDDMVSNDIGILRGKIEQASWEYSAAR